MARLNDWDVIALASYIASWILILMGIFIGLPAYPWARIAMVLMIWPPIYVGWRIYSS